MIDINEFPNTIIDDCLLINGDCLKVMDKLIDNNIKVDAIITDPPYSTTELKWDKSINFIEKLPYILKEYGNAIIFSQPPLTGHIHTNKYLKHVYDYVWIKNKTSRYLDAKYRPMSKFEYINILGRYSPCNANNGKFTYNPQNIISLGYKIIPNRKKTTCNTTRGNYVGQQRESFTGYPSNILYFDSVGKERRHPTQKPIELMEYLIKTYTNENELVLDFTAGSFSTGVACQNTNRKFIGIELEEKYYNIGIERMINNKGHNDKTKTNK